MDILGKKMTEESKAAVDVIAASTGIASFATWLPPIAALFTVVWTGIRIYEYFKNGHVGDK